MLDRQCLGARTLAQFDRLDDASVLLLRYLQDRLHLRCVGARDVDEGIGRGKGQGHLSLQRPAQHRALRGLQQQLMETVVQANIAGEVGI